MNQLYSMMGNTSPMVRQFIQFRNSFRGDPRQQIQQMLNTGQITQAQYDRAAQMANQLAYLIK